MGGEQRLRAASAIAQGAGDELAEVLVVAHEEPARPTHERHQPAAPISSDDRAEDALGADAEHDPGTEHDPAALEHVALELELRPAVVRAGAGEGGERGDEDEPRPHARRLPSSSGRLPATLTSLTRGPRADRSQAACTTVSTPSSVPGASGSASAKRRAGGSHASGRRASARASAPDPARRCARIRPPT